MSAALKDLPDPLDTSPAMATSNPDDLLAKMADEAIDRLMADADKGQQPASPVPPVPMDAVEPAAETLVPPPAAPEASTPGASAPSASGVGASGVGPTPAAEPTHVPADTSPASAGAATGTAAAPDFAAAFESARRVDDVVAVPPSSSAGAPVGPPAGPAADASALAPPAALDTPSSGADVRALLQDSAAAHKPSPLLLPLTWINAPFAGMSDDARRLVGLLGLVTLVPAAMAIFYVVWLKRHLG